MKTLKDISYNIGKNQPMNKLLRVIDDYESIYYEKELKKVAKEWLQYIKENEKESGFKIGDDWIEFSSCIGGEYNPATSPDYTLELFIKHFFNLDVEDEEKRE